ncbi:MAG: Holliday junction branch migration protein RuvA [Acidimicrobiales bacterium]
MIGSLRGCLLERRSQEALIEVAGVGWRVQLGGSALSRLGATGSSVFLYVHHHIREDHQSLYGFVTAAERDCFESLISAHGVGPALAMAVLSVHAPDQLIQILADGDLNALCLVPGVGKKTAARLLVELRAKLDVDALAAGGVFGSGGGSSGANGAGVGVGAGGIGVGSGSPRMVVRQALAELGYEPEEIRAALDAVAAEEPALVEGERARGSGGGSDGDAGADTVVGSAEDQEAALLRAALRRLAGGR